MMIQMMQNLLYEPNVHQQNQPPNPLVSMRLQFPPATHTSSTNQATTTSISTSQSDSDAAALVASMNKANLETEDSTKKLKTADMMHTDDYPPLTHPVQSLPTQSMVDTESLPPNGDQ